MRTPGSLSQVTLQSLENCRQAAAQTVLAYRAGSHRLLGAVNGTLKDSVYPRTAKLAPAATYRADSLRGNFSAVVVKGIDQMAERAEQVIHFSASSAEKQLHKAAEFAAGIHNPIVANGLQTAARLTLPGAQAALALSAQAVKGAHALADLAGARPVRAAVRKAAAAGRRQAAPAARRAQATLKSAGRRAAKAGQAPVAQAERALRGAGKAVHKAAKKAAVV